MSPRLRVIACILLAILVVPGLAESREGRLIGKVLDPGGEPIEGVLVTVSAPELPQFVESDTSDKRGIFKIDFPQLYVVYRLRFDKAGYDSFVSEIDWSLSGTERQEFTMHPAGTLLAEGVPAESVSDPAITAFNAGVKAYDARDFATAERSFLVAVDRDPQLRRAWGALSLVQLELEHYQGAADSAEKAMALGSTNEGVLRARWEAYRNLGDEAKTAAALQDLETTGQRAEEAKRLYNEGVDFLGAGNDQSAMERFKEALELDPNLREAQEGVATTGLKLERYQEAAAAAESILAEDPDNEQAIRVRFNACLALKDEAKLGGALLDLAKFEPSVARDGLLQLAFAAYDVNDLARASDLFGKVLQIDPNHALAHYYLGIARVGQGETEEAKIHLRRFLELAPDHAEAETAREMLEFLGTSK